MRMRTANRHQAETDNSVKAIIQFFKGFWDDYFRGQLILSVFSGLLKLLNEYKYKKG